MQVLYYFLGRTKHVALYHKQAGNVLMSVGAMQYLNIRRVLENHFDHMRQGMYELLILLICRTSHLLQNNVVLFCPNIENNNHRKN